MSKKETYEQKAEEMILPIVEANGFELVDVEYVKEGQNWYLRAYIDKECGITVDDCEIVRREFSDKLDENDFIEDAYILEVSSPGLGRPLKKEKDYQRSMGKELEIQNMSFDSALIAVQQGKADFAAAGISITPEREEAMDFSIEYATSRQVVVVNKNTMAVESVDAITPETKIGVQAGNVADSYCDEQGWQKTQYNKFMEAAMDLKNNKIDCIIMDSLPAEQLVAANDDLMILDGELFTDKYAIAVQKGNTELLDQINAVLQQLIDDGKIDEYTLNHTTE